MDRKTMLTKTLAVVGTALVWCPIVAPLLLSGARLIQARRFVFDYLMPAELFPAVLVGGGLLLWAALRARSRREVIGWALGGAVAFLAACMGLAAVSGMASGAIEASGPWFVLVVSALIAYCLAVVVLGMGGVLLLRDLFGRRA
jgi:cytochrome c oxidase assembly factor CtaG